MRYLMNSMIHAHAVRVSVSTLAVGAALLLSSVAPVAAAPGVNDVCTGDIDAAFASHGQCVSTFETYSNKGNADVVGLCKFFGDNSGYVNPGQCVETLRHRGF